MPKRTKKHVVQKIVLRLPDLDRRFGTDETPPLATEKPADLFREE